MRLFSDLRNNFGQSTVRKVRDWDRLENKLSRHRNHLVFNLRCKKEKVIPASLNIKSPIKTNIAENIVAKARKDLLCERIRINQNQIKDLNSQLSQAKDRVFRSIPEADYNKVQDFITRSKEKEFIRSRSRQQSKLERLIKKEHGSSNCNDLDLSGSQLRQKWVVNLSKKTLKEEESSVLAKGLSYAVTPNKLPVEEFVVATELASVGLSAPKANLLRNDVVGILKNAKAPPSNVTSKERRALKDLAADKDITIVPADKGKATVVLDTQSYKDKVSGMLNDTKTYEVLPNDPTASYKRKLVSLLKPLKDQGKISQRLYEHLYPTAENIPRLYCIPKLHKEGIPLRPIVDYIGSIGYHTSRLLADILSPLVGKTAHHVNNSKDLAEEFKDINVSGHEILVSFDVVSLFTNTPIVKSLEVVKERLLADPDLKGRTKLAVDDIISLLDFILSTTYFSFDDKIYRQKFGAAMGSPVSPIVANIFMEYLEQKAISTAPDDIKPRIWKRYVDDILAIVNKDKVLDLKEHLDLADESGSIKFTHELEVDSSIPFLDTRITKKPDGSVKLKVYRKKTHTGQYLNFNSHHPLHQKLGVIRTLMDRAHSIVSEEEDLISEENHIRSSLKECGYPNWAFRKPKPRPHQEETKKQKMVTIPYVKGTSEALQRIFRKYDVKTALKPVSKIRNFVVHPKDKRSVEDNTGVIYRVPCGNCSKAYVGETSRKFGTRKREHKQEVESILDKHFTRGSKESASSKLHKSAISDHVAKENHFINWKDCSILARDPFKFSRWVREAVYIRKEKDTLNRDIGQFNLSSVYDPILSKSASQQTPTTTKTRQPQKVDLKMARRN